MKALKVTAIAFLITSIAIPAKLAISKMKGPNVPDKNTIAAQDKSTDSDSGQAYIKTSLDYSISSDFGQYSFYKNNDYPTTAMKGSPIKIEIESSGQLANYKVQIEGDNGYTSECINSGSTWQWTPDQVGIFNIVVIRSNGEAAATRKIYVNDAEVYNKGYLQLGDLAASADKTSPTTISTTIASIPSTYKDNPGRIKFVIGESLVWSKTVKEEALGSNPLNTTYSINEDQGNDGFKFNQGIYQISASVQGEHSIEDEDEKAIDYRKSGLDDLKLTLDMKKIQDNKGYTFTAKVTGADTNIKDKLEYAFILWDQRGWRLIQDYSPQNTFNFTPECLSQSDLPEGKYRIYARVKQASDANANLENSYEAETYIELATENNNSTKIKGINICAYEAKENNIKHDCKKGYAVSHEMNIIKITASHPSDLKLKYKAYAIHDGCCYPICDYSDSEYIPFYPKSSGSYNLIIFAKVEDSKQTVLEFDREEYDIAVTDLSHACN